MPVLVAMLVRERPHAARARRPVRRRGGYRRLVTKRWSRVSSASSAMVRVTTSRSDTRRSLRHGRRLCDARRHRLAEQLVQWRRQRGRSSRQARVGARTVRTSLYSAERRCFPGEPSTSQKPRASRASSGRHPHQVPRRTRINAVAGTGWDLLGGGRRRRRERRSVPHHARVTRTTDARRPQGQHHGRRPAGVARARGPRRRSWRRRASPRPMTTVCAGFGATASCRNRHVGSSPVVSATSSDVDPLARMASSTSSKLPIQNRR